MKEGVDDRPTAPNEPDPSSTTNLFFLHGVNVNERSARGWNAEMFKRLYWSGSKARFHGITWYGDKGSDANYQENVNHAFKTAPHLKDYVSSVSGTKIMLAHSLGNMVVSSAIQDYDMSVQKYLMLDAAVAIEAYDNTSSDIAAMRHPDWIDYNNRLWATEWHQLFDEGDGRRALTWRGRFANVVSKAYNFYSSGEEVLERHTGTPHELSVAWNKGEFAWCLQEKLKGCFEFLPWGGSTYGGWGFNDLRYPYPLRELYKGNGHTRLSDEQLCSQPLFDRGWPGIWALYYNSGSSYAFKYQSKFLAQMIPALSLPVGANKLNAIPDSRNFNMDTDGDDGFKNGWGRNHTEYGQRWLHSDIRDMSYLYVYKVFDKFAGEGGLKQ